MLSHEPPKDVQDTHARPCSRTLPRCRARLPGARAGARLSRHQPIVVAGRTSARVREPPRRPRLTLHHRQRRHGRATAHVHRRRRHAPGVVARRPHDPLRLESRRYLESVRHSPGWHRRATPDGAGYVACVHVRPAPRVVARRAVDRVRLESGRRGGRVHHARRRDGGASPDESRHPRLVDAGRRPTAVQPPWRRERHLLHRRRRTRRAPAVRGLGQHGRPEALARRPHDDVLLGAGRPCPADRHRRRGPQRARAHPRGEHELRAVMVA